MHLQKAFCLFFLYASLGLAQQARFTCEASPESYALLSKLQETYYDSRIDFEQRMAPLRSALKEHPDDIYLHRYYQDRFTNYVMLPWMEGVVEEYKQLAEKHPGDLNFKYLYGRILNTWRNREAFAIAQQVAEAAPDFPWVHLELWRLYMREEFKDKAKQQSEIEKFVQLCPASLDPEPYRFYSNQTAEFKLTAARNLRARLQESSGAQASGAYAFLWPLEFERKPSEYPDLRKQIAKDLEKLRKSDDPPLPVLARGYEIVEDRDGARWVREQMQERAPNSTRTADAMIVRWLADRPKPNQEDSRERVQGYYRELYHATDEWIKQWPLFMPPWSLRFQALRELPDEPAAQLQAAGEGYLNAERLSPNGMGYPPSMQVASALIDRGASFDRAAELARREVADQDKRIADDRKPEAGFVPSFILDRADADREETYWQTQLLLVRSAIGKHDAEQAHRILAEMERALEKPGLDRPEMYWFSRPRLAEAYVITGELAKANPLLASIKKWLDKNTPGESADSRAHNTHIDREVAYWEAAELLAEAEGRDRDALEAAQKVIQLRRYWNTLNARFAYIDKTHALWIKTGGDEAMWQEWLAHGSKTIETTAESWRSVTRKLPDFEAFDLQGKRWTLADFKGKRTLITMWATWCGPCHRELPYFQKLYSQLKDRKDVQVVTWNVDEDRTAIEPFVRREAFSFPVLLVRPYVQQTLGIHTYPTTWVIEPDGTVHLEQLGFTAEPNRWVTRVIETLNGK